MLEDLRIKDFALIDSSYVEFAKGFTVLSGETGAGKSILIGALSFLLGGKAGVESIRAGQSEASVTGTFLLPAAAGDRDLSDDPEAEPLSAREWLSQHGIEDEDGRIILRRIIRNTGKSGAWINGAAVPRADLAAFSQFLIDIHGQHEHQSLMRVAEHRKFLDGYCGIVEEVAAFTKLYAALVEKRQILDSLNTGDEERRRRIDYLNYSIEEIENAKLRPGEDVELEAEESRLSSFEKLYSEIHSINSLFSGGETGGIESLLKQVRSSSERASSFDKSLEALDSRIQNVFYEISDLSGEFKSYENSLVFDPARLEQVQSRLDLIYRLKKKYTGGSDTPLSALFDCLEKSRQEVETLDSSAENRDALVKEIAALEKQVYESARAISQKRTSASQKMSAQVEAVLQKLGMPGTKFSVNITQKDGDAVEQKCGPYGMDNIEFLISANPGSPLAPLSKIASGGELSRVMLALKTVFARNDRLETLIFDEIDTGIGGEVAVAVGEHMKNLSKNRQILCITHLASIAVYADNQIRIQKSAQNGMTKTAASVVSGQERVAEIARMLSGDSHSEQSLEHAAAMLKKFCL